MDGMLEFSFGPPHFEECSQAASVNRRFLLFFLAKFSHLPKHFCPKKKKEKVPKLLAQGILFLP